MRMERTVYMVFVKYGMSTPPFNHKRATCRLATYLFFTKHSQQTQGFDLMLVYCWTNAVDGWPTLNQIWVNVLCSLGIGNYIVDDIPLIIQLLIFIINR